MVFDDFVEQCNKQATLLSKEENRFEECLAAVKDLNDRLSEWLEIHPVVTDFGGGEGNQSNNDG